MKGVTIFGNFTVLETFMFNDLQIDKGFDERLDIFYRVNLYIENLEDDINDTFIDCYYRSINDLMEDIKCYSINQT
ncbi:MAG: hypothetical protein PWQ37_2574 [Candidatus Petromonas sp.]|jgi:hypothetical protein|uniref:Uncharacterized protein n=2 Tax=Clostridia TaxID=186801 RepID=G2JCB0_ACET2|nr:MULTISPECIES: hypothetical protein [Clostridia]AEO12432.1 hypothetical protein Cthe_3373 [Acetivibrio thermocellus ATCC 27405]MDK2919841.1 hypothetical protein [Candidatus Petromonas sp.]SHK18327.1 hypothetical protein SAMN02745975_03827 [Geosporobacter subterraneus DSM 17957]